MDDHQGNIDRAVSRGLKALLYRDYDLLVDELKKGLGRRLIPERF